MDRYPFDFTNVTWKNSKIDLYKNQEEELLKILSVLKGYSVQGALDLLDNAKHVVLECTQIVADYK